MFSAPTARARCLASTTARKTSTRSAASPAGRLHDLRRTSRTLLSRAGITADIAERCLGHAITGVRGTYDRHEYIDEKRHAFEALASLIARIVHPSSDEVVVPMKGARK